MRSRCNILIIILGILVAIFCFVYSSRQSPYYSDLGKLKVKLNTQKEMLVLPIKKRL